MKCLTNITTSQCTMQWFDGKWKNVKDFIDRNGLDGVELMLHGNADLREIKKECVVGMHLQYWPIWLDFWRGNTPALLSQFGSEQDIIHFYGGLDKQVLIDHYKKEFEAACELGVEYVVFHVAHVELSHAYTQEFTYNDLDVLSATAELVNQAFRSRDRGIKLLFENLWWPGLTLTDAKSAKEFLDMIEYPNKGFMLDIGHMMATNCRIRTEDDACEYILSNIGRLKELKGYIKGIHLNKSLSGCYLSEDHSEEAKLLESKPSFWEKIRWAKEHISQIDRHLPFDHPSIKKVIEAVNPEYLVFEVLAQSLEELEKMITAQKKVL